MEVEGPERKAVEVIRGLFEKNVFCKCNVPMVMSSHAGTNPNHVCVPSQHGCGLNTEHSTHAGR